MRKETVKMTENAKMQNSQKISTDGAKIAAKLNCEMMGGIIGGYEHSKMERRDKMSSFLTVPFFMISNEKCLFLKENCFFCVNFRKTVQMSN